MIGSTPTHELYFRWRARGEPAIAAWSFAKSGRQPGCDGVVTLPQNFTFQPLQPLAATIPAGSMVCLSPAIPASLTVAFGDGRTMTVPIESWNVLPPNERGPA